MVLVFFSATLPTTTAVPMLSYRSDPAFYERALRCGGGGVEGGVDHIKHSGVAAW